jgi:beta-galactosidase
MFRMQVNARTSRPVLIFMLMCVAVTAPLEHAWAADTGPVRIDRTLSAGWKFIELDRDEFRSALAQDAPWQAVTVPHTWNVADAANGGNYYRGPAWYHLNLEISPELARKSLFLRFGAAALVAEVYVNGKPAGTHQGGFSAFCFEVTDLLYTGTNLLAVRVSNAVDQGVAPLSGDFTVYGGLYREVHLLALDPVSFSPTDDASSGLYLKTSVATDQAQIQATAKLRNGSNQPAAISVHYILMNAAGETVQESSVDQILGSNSLDDSVATLKLDHPHLWNGRLDPYLYRMVVEVKKGQAVLDRIEQPLGLRFFTVDPQSGLILNGRPYDLHGVDLHQGRPSVGYAVTPAMEEEDYKLVAEMGCTAVRLAHYQHSDYELTLCDQSGIVAWSELALVNKMKDTPAFRDNVKQQLRELIKQQYNHPSVFFWSMYNEPWINPKAGTKEQWRLIIDLVALAHQLDPSRLTTGAVSEGTWGDIDWYMDITGMNRYFGWYVGGLADWASQMSALHARLPNKSIGISEYGAGASAFQHETHPVHPAPNSRWHPEEWQALVHENAWQSLRDQHWLFSKFIWCMFDFGSAGRNEGDHPGMNDKGLVTADRAIRKDAYFYYKACWTSDPFVHICDRRFNPRPLGQADLKVYSNCSHVELTLNGRSLGIKTSPEHIFVWPNVNLIEGNSDLRAVGSTNDKTFSDSLTWNVSAALKETIHPAFHPTSQ